MSADDVTMRQIVEAARSVFTDDGVAIYLGAQNTVFGQRPIDLCRTAEGRRRVLNWLDGSAHGAFT